MATANPSVLHATVTPIDLFEIAYTGSWREGVPGVPYYVSGGEEQITASEEGTVRGSDISLAANALFELAGGSFVYSITANVFCTVPGATYQWFQEAAENYIWEATPCGTPSTFIWTPADDEVLTLRVQAPAGTTFEYPAKVTGGEVTIQVVSGYTVA